MNPTDQIECAPYRCSLSVRGCAARYAAAQEPAAGYKSKGHLAHCKTCADGRKRWVQLGKKEHRGRGAVNWRNTRESSLATYIPRVGVP